MYYEIGIGIGLAFAVFVLLVLVLNKKKKTKQIMYDEMQTAVRGRAYQYATITGVLAGIIASCLVDLDIFPMDGSFAMMTVSFLMITVYIVYMVMKGVYFALQSHHWHTSYRRGWAAGRKANYYQHPCHDGRYVYGHRGCCLDPESERETE